MTNQWFRFYDDALNNPKVQRLSPVLFKVWVNLLCLASKNDGVLPCVDDMVFSLRSDKKTVTKQISELMTCGLIDEENERLQPHNWDDRQFKSDTSKERTKAYMERLKGRHGDSVVTSQVTPQETDTETDTERRITHTNADARKPVTNRNQLKLENLSYEDIQPWIIQQSVSGNPITVDVRAELERFKTHFLSYGGKDKNGNAISDWVAKFGSWILNEQKQQKYGAKNEKTIGRNQSGALSANAGNEKRTDAIPAGNKSQRAADAFSAIISQRNAEYAAAARAQTIDADQGLPRLPE